jgi:hypothetical protein
LPRGARLVVVSADDSIMVDKLIITDDAGYQPSTADDRKAAPARVKGLRATKTTANSIELAWEPSPDPDVYCYSVYVGKEADFTPGNETLLCSPRRAAAADWGIRPDTTYHYKVVVVDKLGNESEPAVVEAKTKALGVLTKALPATAAKATAGLTEGTMSGAEYVEYPGKDAGEQSLTFNLDLPADGTYYVWMKYTPTFNQRWAWDSMGVSWDGGKVESYLTRPRPPRGQARAKDRRWFVERLASEKAVKAGKHAITLSFKDGDVLHTRMGQRIAKLWVSNDASFVPPGYTAQVMFSKPTPWVR